MRRFARPITWLIVGPFGRRDFKVVELYSGIVEDQSDGLCSSLYWKIIKLVVDHLSKTLRIQWEKTIICLYGWTDSSDKHTLLYAITNTKAWKKFIERSGGVFRRSLWFAARHGLGQWIAPIPGTFPSGSAPCSWSLANSWPPRSPPKWLRPWSRSRIHFGSKFLQSSENAFRLPAKRRPSSKRSKMPIKNYYS